MSLLDVYGFRIAVKSGGRAALALLLVCSMTGAIAGCKKNNGNSSDGGSSSGGAGGGAAQDGKTGGSAGGAGNQLSQPVDSTTGQPSTDSDDGSPRAVGHTSTAMPGAPEGTLKGNQQDKKLDSPESQGSPRASSPTPPQSPQ